MAGIFVSYRRDDSQGFAGRLADDLTDVLGSELVFRDVEIPVGHDFTDVLHRAVAACDVLIVVIGRNWQAASTRSSRSRLFDPTDWVRAEIEAAFEQGKQVIPVLVGGAKMSKASDLPESIAHLSKIQAYTMSDQRWDHDIPRLVGLIRKEVPELKPDASQERQDQAESPAQVLRELGDRVLNEVIRQRDNAGQPENTKHFQRHGFVAGIGKFARKVVVSIITIAAIYIGVRLFGDAEMLRVLDQFEVRLHTGWSRFLTYLQSLS